MSTIGDVQAAIAACDTGAVKLHDAAKKFDDMSNEIKAALKELKKLDMSSGAGKKIATLVDEATAALAAADGVLVDKFMTKYSTMHGQVTDKFKSAYKGKLKMLQEAAAKDKVAGEGEKGESETEEKKG
jgi:hypothetical protein